jgi:predicted nucleic acid-binding protein
MVIVDTDVLIDVFRRYTPAVEWLAKTVAENEVVLPGYVVMELIQGARNREEQEKMRKTIEEYAVVWPSEDTCNQATELLAKYHLSGGIGIIDALIGQLALDMGLPLHTCNKKHYENVSGLDVIEPYQKNAH